MVSELLKQGKAKMESVIAATKKAFSGIRTGRANPSLLDRIQVEYYGAMTPLNQMATISVPEPRLLVIQPWDKTIIKDIEKAIQTSDLDLNPSNDGNVIRIAIPALTEERRKQLVRLLRKETEDHRVGVRNIRRELNDEIKKAEKDGELSEDEARRAMDEVQKMTDSFIQVLEDLSQEKEQEIMEI